MKVYDILTVCGKIYLYRQTNIFINIENEEFSIYYQNHITKKKILANTQIFLKFKY